MPQMLTCPQGHQWEPASQEQGATTDLEVLCPICGVLGVQVPPDSGDSLPETIEHVSDDDAADSPTPLHPDFMSSPFVPLTEGADAVPETTDGAEPSVAAEKARAARRARRPVVAGYEILGELGRGGMGVVYKARQIKLNRLVALKMILAGTHAGPQHLERFRTEAEAVARLQHPNIVQIHEIGEQEGLPFFSLEYVDGGSLAEKLARTPLAARQAAELMLTLARAMDAAHRRDIIHRDLKPANVLLTRDGTPKITDFGLAKKLDEEEGQTRSGVVMGTPSYMAPEQAEGKTHEVGPAADIYALGAILYEATIGRPPFKSATLLDTLMQVRTQEPIPPRQLIPNLPRDLETICLKCLHKTPGLRYVTAGALADDLGRWLAGVPILARPTSPGERVWKWVRRRPGVSALLALLIATAALGFALVTWQWQRAETERDKAEQLAASEGEAKREVEKQKDAAVEARHEADARRRDAQRTATRLLLERGVGMCQQRQYGPGLLWLARGLESAPEDAPELGESLRTLLGSWGTELCRTTLVLEHPPRVLSAALSPDGKRIATGGWDKMARLWDAATGKPIGKPLPHPNVVYRVSFSPDSATLFTVSGENTARMWHAATGAPRGELPRHPNRVHAVACSPDGKRVLTGCRDKNARLWDLATGQLVGAPLPHDNEVGGVAFSPDGKRMATGTKNGVARLWDADTGKPLGEPMPHNYEVSALAFSPDGTSLLTGSSNLKAQLWDVPTGKPRGEPLVHQGAVGSVAFSPDGRTLLTSSFDGTVRLWDRTTGQPVGEMIRHQGAVSSAVFRADGRAILTGSIDGTARLWSVSGSKPWHEARWHQGRIQYADFSPDGRTILTASEDKTVRLWDAATGKPRGQPMTHAGAIYEARFDPRGQYILTRSGDLLQVWDADTGKRRGAMRHDAPINSAVFSPDGRFVLSACVDRTARLWNADTCQPVGQPFEHAEMATAVAFSPDGELLVTASAEGVARFRQTASREPWHEPLQHGEPIVAVAFSPDGAILMTRGALTVRLWDVRTGKPLGSPVRHTNIIQNAVFSSDSKFVVTAGSDRIAQLVEAATGKPVCAPLPHADMVLEAVFRPDGKILVTRSGNAVRLWRASTGEPIGESLRHPSAVQAALFSPDGKILLMGSEDGTVRAWDTTTSQPAGEAFRHPEALTTLAIHPTGRTFLVAGRNGRVRLWEMAAPAKGQKERIKQQLQVNIGLELDPGGATVWFDGPSWWQKWRALQEANAPADR